MALPWCCKCKNKSQDGMINTICLSCKWQYVGTEFFERKANCYEDSGNKEFVSPDDYFGDSIELIGSEFI